MLVGGIALMVSLYLLGMTEVDPGTIKIIAIIGSLGILIGAFIALGWLPKSIKAPGGIEVGFADDVGIYAESYYQEAITLDRPQAEKTLDAAIEEERRAYAARQDVPGRDAPEFDTLQDKLAFKIIPVSDRMAPMYLLDPHFRVVDWNNAFSLAFDWTLEGRRGKSVLEWVYYLDNYKEVLDHGVEAFKDPANFPNIDIETITYTSMRYGTFDATKRAYKIPADNGRDVLGWLIILELLFRDRHEKIKFQGDLVRLDGIDNMWTEYSITYDRVLLNTNVYHELLDEMIGGRGNFPAIPDNARVLDLGAGTGNITERLANMNKGFTIVALDNNSAMLELLKSKCITHLVDDDQQPGVVVRKQDITSLFGLRDGYFDCAILNNVLYSLSDPKSCLAEVRRVLRKGGEIRISGPKRDTDLDLLFDRIKADIVDKRLFDKLKSEYEHVRKINNLRLKPFLFKWTNEEVEDLLMQAGFSEVTYSTDCAYAGQAMIVGARK